MAAHRYWRVIIHRSNNNSFTGLTELQLRSSVGGADLTGSGTAIAETPIQSGSADAVFDNSLTTQIQWGGNGVNKWVGYDFGVGVEHDIIELVMHTNKDLASRGPRDWTLQYSDDGSSWFASGLVCNYTAWVIGTAVTFTKPSTSLQTHARIRWATSDEGPTGSCAEMEFRGTVGGANLATGGTATASTTYSGTYSADKAFDGSASTFWSGNGGVLLAEWLAYEFTSAVDVQEVVHTARGDSVAGQNPRTGWLEASPDGFSWLVVEPFSVDAWVVGETKTLLSRSAAVAAPNKHFNIHRYHPTSTPLEGIITEAGEFILTEGGDTLIEE